ASESVRANGRRNEDRADWVRRRSNRGPRAGGRRAAAYFQPGALRSCAWSEAGNSVIDLRALNCSIATLTFFHVTNSKIRWSLFRVVRVFGGSVGFFKAYWSLAIWSFS